jgi:glycosyltransferase involved in cell wall biosynthesis
VPVVATSVGAIPQVLSLPEAGTLVVPGSPEALADAIERGLASLHSVTARSARAAAVSAFSQEKRAGALVALYRELLAR